MNCASFTEAARNFGSKIAGMAGNARQHIAQTEIGIAAQQRMHGFFEGIKMDSGRAMFRDNGAFINRVRSDMGAGIGTKETVREARYGAQKYLRKDYARNARIGLGVGAGLGALNAYRNEDGAGGYALNIAGGMGAGIAGAHLTSMAMRKGTGLYSAFAKGAGAVRGWTGR